MLRYSIQSPAEKFSINAENGDLTGESDLLTGIHRFNISVTDGKFHTSALVTVDVSFFPMYGNQNPIVPRYRRLIKTPSITP
jgi:hypothetical protein